MSLRGRQPSGLSSVDWATFSIYLALIAVGWLMVLAVDYADLSMDSMGAFLRSSPGKQILWIGISLLAFSFVMLIEWKFWQTFAYLIYTFSIVLLIAVLIFGTTIKGATSWFTLFGFSFQPSEIAKFSTCLALSSFLSSYHTDLRDFRSQFIAFALIFAPIFLIMLQPDAGSALVFLSFLLVLYRQGLSSNYYIVGIVVSTISILGLVYPPKFITLGLVLLGLLLLALNFKAKVNWFIGYIIFAAGLLFAQIRLPEYGDYYLIGAFIVFALIAGMHYFQKNRRLVQLLSLTLVISCGIAFAANYFFNNLLEPHQQDRLNVWLQPSKSDPRGPLYNVLQSKMAISSGGLQGKGYLNGTMTKLNYVPEQSTDFIFCTVGEEQGFIGSFGIIVLFLLLLIRLTILAERQRNTFSQAYAYCVAGIIFIHFFINIGMTMGLMPIIGIPLPFISKGGSSLLGFTIMLAVLLKLDSNRYLV